MTLRTGHRAMTKGLLLVWLLLAALCFAPVQANGSTDGVAFLSSCLDTPSTQECRSFRLSKEDVRQSLNKLCSAGHTNQYGFVTSLPFLAGCELARACGVLSDSPFPTICSPFRVLATVCADQPTLSGCSQYRRMCSYGTAVEACTAEPPFAGSQHLHTRQALTSVQMLCGWEGERGGKMPSKDAVAAACSSCNLPKNAAFVDMAAGCPNVIHTLATICAASGGPTGIDGYDVLCSGWRAFCGANSKLFPAFCDTDALNQGRSRIGPDGYPQIRS